MAKLPLTNLPNGLSTSVLVITDEEMTQQGVRPDSVPSGNGFTVTFNSDGYNSVDFWNLTNNSAGFYFHQKTSDTTSKRIVTLYYDETAETSSLDLEGPNGAISLRAGIGYSILDCQQSLVVNYTMGMLFANRPQGDDLIIGMTTVFIDSNTNVWGATIAGGGANRVLAFYNGTTWTVMAK